MRYSRIHKVGDRQFRYNYERNVIEYIYKATKEDLEENREWREKHGRDLYEIDEKGYCIVDSVGLSLSSWKDKDSREYYLQQYAYDLEEEFRWEEELFVKYELPLYDKERSAME